MERRFRWNVRQVLATIAETERAVGEVAGRRDWVHFVTARAAGLRAFFAAIDVGFGAFAQGKPLDPAALRSPPLVALPRPRQRS